MKPSTFAPGPGHNSGRDADFERTAAELGHKRLQAEIRGRTRNQRIKPDMPYFLEWQWELACSDAPSSQKLTGLILHLFADPDGKNAAASIRTLAALTGLAKKTVASALEGLEKRMFASDKKEGSGTRPDSYSLVIPARTLEELAEGLTVSSVQPSRTLADSAVCNELGHKPRNNVASVLLGAPRASCV